MRQALLRVWVVLRERPTHRPSPYDRTSARVGSNPSFLVFSITIGVLSVVPLFLMLASGGLYGALVLSIWCAGSVAAAEGVRVNR